MRYGLGHRIVWYMIMNVYKEHSVFGSLQVVPRWRQSVLTKTSAPTNQITLFYNLENYDFES
jgi:hypothetical protein